MAQENVELLIPFESLINCIEKLSMQEKIRLWELLDEEISQVEEDILEQDPIRVARGFLKGSRFTSERYMQLKQEEKELEK
jgi:hypothetical protein